MKADDEARDYEDGEIVLTTFPAVPIPDAAADDGTPPFDVAPLKYAA